MPTFIRPEPQPDSIPPGERWMRSTALATCPECKDTAEGWGKTQSAAAKDACRNLSGECRCMRASGGLRFLIDGTPVGVTLWLADRTGNLHRCHMYENRVRWKNGVHEPGSVPIVVCTDDYPPSGSKKSGDSLRWWGWVEGVAERFRRKRWYVQLAVQKPDKLAGDVLGPLPPKAKKAKEVVNGKAVRK